MKFKVVSPFKPTGDQPEAIKQLAQGVNNAEPFQILLGVTGSGKTFTVANVIQEVQKPALILSHNKTLAAQLYGEFKQFFPENKVEYFVSYYDYYQPEAYLPVSNTYIEKDLSINSEIEKLRLSTTSALLSGRQDIIVVSSVSCIYGMGNPDEYYQNVIRIKKGQRISRNQFLHQLVNSMYSRSEVEFEAGNFRVKGDTVDVYLAYAAQAYRVEFFGDEIEKIEAFNPINGYKDEDLNQAIISPANLFVTTKSTLTKAIDKIGEDMVQQVDFLKSNGQHLEAKRLEDRVTHDLEMMRELGYCSGIENYSRYFDGRKPGTRPFCLLDYFPNDFLMIIDESHVTIPQIRGMYGGDRSRKINLVEYGFRLPSAMDNRPLTFDEFESFKTQTIYVSATPADYELEKCSGVVVEQVIRPTGLLDPVIVVKPSLNQVDDLLAEVRERMELKERVLITTLTKRMAEELTRFMSKAGILCAYIHSEVDTLERVEILRNLRLGKFDVLIGVNLLREGLDLPEVSLVAVLDADKEGFLRSARSLTQTAGRAARNLNGKVILYADRITDAMRITITETERRREKQHNYNLKHGLTPKALNKSSEDIIGQTKVAGARAYDQTVYEEPDKVNLAADPLIPYMNVDQLKKLLKENKSKMEKAAKALDFLEAARLRDENSELEKLILSKQE